MKYSASFIHAFCAAMRRHGHWNIMTPDEILNSWDEFVRDCEEGYDEPYHDYLNYLLRRQTIEETVTDPAVKDMHEVQPFLEQLHTIDNRFRAILQNSPLPGRSDRSWWEAYAPRYAGSELAEDLHTRYGISITVID